MMEVVVKILACAIVTFLYLRFMVKEIRKNYAEWKKSSQMAQLRALIRHKEYHDMFIERLSKTKFQAKTMEECQIVSDMNDLGLNFDKDLYEIVINEVETLNSL